MSTTSFRVLDFGFRIADLVIWFNFSTLSTKITYLQSKMKKAMGESPMAFVTFDEQVVSDRQRQWAPRKGTKGAVALG
jgi:hypothetical protein